MTLTELFTNIAKAIREKDGTTEAIPAEDFASRIENINAKETKAVGYAIAGNGTETISKSGVSDTFASVYDHLINNNNEVYCSIYAASSITSNVETGRYVYFANIERSKIVDGCEIDVVYRDNSISGHPLGSHNGTPLYVSGWTQDGFVITSPYNFASDLTYHVVFWSENIG